MQTGLQFFATNRSMTNLGKVDDKGKEDRDQRLNLMRGGYYFVNMYKYMPYFFAEVDNDSMPDAAVVKNSQDEVFAKFLASKAVGRVVVCIHGFNVHLQAAYTWFRILTDTMRNEGLDEKIVTSADDPKLAKYSNGELTAFIGFSWPSNGNVFSYNRDQMDAVNSAQPLANLLARLHLYKKEVNLLCHSMGNYAACNMMEGLINEAFVPACFTTDYIKSKDFAKEAEAGAVLNKYLELIKRGAKQADETVTREKYFIENYVMVAPDVERRHVTKGIAKKEEYIGPFYSGLQHLAHRVTNVYSRFDGALNISNIDKKPKAAVLAVGDALSNVTFGLLDFLERNPDYKWEMRLGSSAHPNGAPPNFRSVNATELAGRPMDHSDHIDSPDVVMAIAKALGLETGVAR